MTALSPWVAGVLPPLVLEVADLAAYARACSSASRSALRGEADAFVFDVGRAAANRTEAGEVFFGWMARNDQLLRARARRIALVAPTLRAWLRIRVAFAVHGSPVPYAVFRSRERAIAWAGEVALAG